MPGPVPQGGPSASVASTPSPLSDALLVLGSPQLPGTASSVPKCHRAASLWDMRSNKARPPQVARDLSCIKCSWPGRGRGSALSDTVASTFPMATVGARPQVLVTTGQTQHCAPLRPRPGRPPCSGRTLLCACPSQSGHVPQSGGRACGCFGAVGPSVHSSLLVFIEY